MRSIIILFAVAAAAAPVYAQGRPGSALRFDGLDDWVDFGPGFGASAPFTIEAWVKPTLASTRPQLIAGPFGAPKGGCYQGAGFRLQPGSATVPGALSFTVGVKGCGNDDLIEGPVPTLDQWVHLAGTYDGSTMRFYVDGALVGELKGIDYTPYGRFVAGCTYDENVGGPDYHFGGEIDDVRFWSHVRTEEQIDDGRWQEPDGTESGLVAAWSLDEGTGQTATETVAGARNGRLGNDADPAGDDADPVWVATGEPPTPEEALEDLIAKVRALDLPECLERHLVCKLEVALRLLRHASARADKACVALLQGFVRSVSRHAGEKIPRDAVDDLMEAALDIVDQLAPGGDGDATWTFRSRSHRPAPRHAARRSNRNTHSRNRNTR